MIYYDSAAIYIDKATDLKDKIDRIDSIINGLQTAALAAASTGNISEYSLDDGQTKIRTVYRDSMQITAAIMSFERIKQTYINQLNGRVSVLRDQNNFR